MATAPRRARLEVDQRRAQLLALALSMFSDRSYDDVSIDGLARAAGVSKGLLYHYFPTKRDLYVAALRHAASRLLDETETDRTAPPDERVRRGLEAYLDFVARHGKAYVALVRGGIGSDPEVAAILESTRDRFVARILLDLPSVASRPILRTTLRGWIGFVEATALEQAARAPRGAGVRRDELLELLGGVLFDAVARAATLSQSRSPVRRSKRRRPARISDG